MYTLAGLANDATGWGVRDETWSAAEMLERYGAPTWFRLGDRDLATHIVRTARLAGGARLTDVTADLVRALDVGARLLPMTDEPLRTKVRTADSAGSTSRITSSAAATPMRCWSCASRASPTHDRHRRCSMAIDAAELVVIAPSNPFVSVAPILALPGVAGAPDESAGALSWRSARSSAAPRCAVRRRT